MKKIISFLALTILVSNVFSQDDGLEVAPTEDKVFTEDVKSIPDPVATIDIDIRAAFPTGEFASFYSRPGMGGFGIDVIRT